MRQLRQSDWRRHEHSPQPNKGGGRYIYYGYEALRKAVSKAWTRQDAVRHVAQARRTHELRERLDREYAAAGGKRTRKPASASQNASGGLVHGLINHAALDGAARFAEALAVKQDNEILEETPRGWQTAKTFRYIKRIQELAADNGRKRRQLDDARKTIDILNGRLARLRNESLHAAESLKLAGDPAAAEFLENTIEGTKDKDPNDN